LIGCAGYQGPPRNLEQIDPALFALPMAFDTNVLVSCW